ncbi:hypothetical protein AR687_24825 [Flavobacteriaceae bacterium CRH]|nr:hypothetical protein AR687_24825 [Flavobacteriaceae bacterium CRH]
MGFLLGPLFYFYVRGTLFDNRKFSKKDLIHLIPAFINLISITPYLLTPFSYKLALAERIFKDTMLAKTFTVGLYPNIVNIIARPTLLALYTIAVIVMLCQFWANMKTNDYIPKKQSRKILIWLFSFVFTVIITSVSFAVLSYLFLREHNPDMANFKTSLLMNIVGFCLLMVPVSLLIFPEILYGIPQATNNKKNDFVSLKTNKKREDKSILKNDIVNNSIIISEKEEKNEVQTDFQEKDIEPRFIELSQSILDYIKESEIYLNPNFSMEELSRSMNVPKHHLYYCFNTILNIKLTKIRAELRIEHAKKLLEQGLSDSLTLDAIVNKAGFSSRSSFQSVFKDEVGCTPGEYLKMKSEIVS